jgi:hypothetical protein
LVSRSSTPEVDAELRLLACLGAALLQLPPADPSVHPAADAPCRGAQCVAM